jgi:hypothetical protein
MIRKPCDWLLIICHQWGETPRGSLLPCVADVKVTAIGSIWRRLHVDVRCPCEQVLNILQLVRYDEESMWLLSTRLQCSSIAIRSLWQRIHVSAARVSPVFNTLLLEDVTITRRGCLLSVYPKCYMYCNWFDMMKNPCDCCQHVSSAQDTAVGRYDEDSTWMSAALAL